VSSTTYKAVVLTLVAGILVVMVAIRLRARATSDAATKPLPAILDFGMGVCEQCKKMKPILEQLAVDYEGRARIQIIDINDRPDQRDKYKVELVPTQVFLDAEGREVGRHVGFMPREDLVARLTAMGVE
jgi:thioredoxin 1